MPAWRFVDGRLVWFAGGNDPAAFDRGAEVVARRLDVQTARLGDGVGVVLVTLAGARGSA